LLISPPLPIPLVVPSHSPIIDPVTVLVHKVVSLRVLVHIYVSPLVPRLEGFSLVEVRRHSGRRRRPGKQVRGRQHGPAKHENEQDGEGG